MVSIPTSPADPVATQPGEPAPSAAATALLILAWPALWFGVLWACTILLTQDAVARDFGIALPSAAVWLFNRSWWDWFASYWWVLVVGVLVLTPVVGLVTYWVRHRRRSRPLRRAWAALVVLPPVLLLAVLAPASILVGSSISHVIRTSRDEPANYLAPDGQHLNSPLTLREGARGPAGAEGKTVVIEPGGDWRVVPGVTDVGRAPLRQGKLTRDQLAVLAGLLAQVRFRQWSEDKALLPALGPDGLVIEFGDRVWSLDWVPRRNLLEGPGAPAGLQPWEAEERARFASLVLTIEELVKPDHAQ